MSDSNYKSELICEHWCFWQNVAEKYGWSMIGRKVQIWLDEDAKAIDSIYLPEGATKDILIYSDGMSEEF